MSYCVIECENREVWLESRKATVGASDVPTILGVNKYKSPYSLWMEKHGDVQPEDLSENESVKWGDILEPVVRKEAERRLGVQVQYDGKYKILVSSENPFLSCTLDGYLSEPSMYIREMFYGDIEGPGVLEIKTAGKYTREAFDNGSLPVQYVVQVMAQMVVTGYRWGIVAYLLEGRTFGIAPVEWGAGLARDIVSSAKAFTNSLESHDTPDPDHRDLGTIARMFPDDHGGTAELGSEFDEIDERLLELKSSTRNDAIEIKALEAKIKDAIGSSTFGVSPGGVRYSFKSQTRKGHSVSPSTYRVLRRLKV